jgi:anti-sigma28 factor (negative regulator of flagellin synthesis)
MQAFRKPTIQAHPPRRSSEANSDDTGAPEQNASTSGTYVLSVRPTVEEAAALARGEPVIDVVKVEGLRFELEVGIWRRDSARIAWHVLDDAENAADCGDDDE